MIHSISQQPAMGQSDKSLWAPWITLILPLWAQPAMSVLKWHHCTAISMCRSSCSSSSRHRHTRAISHIRTAAHCLTLTSPLAKPSGQICTSQDKCSLLLLWDVTTWTAKHPEPSVSRSSISEVSSCSRQAHPTCLSPQRVKVVDLSPLHLLLVLLGQVQQVGHNLPGDKIQDGTD